jgi:agmatinase
MAGEILLNEDTRDKTFLDDRRNHDYNDADVALLGVACDLTASYNKGAWYGPRAIIDASHQVEYETPLFNKCLTDLVKIHNLGVLECPPPFDEAGQPMEYSKKDIQSCMEHMVSATELYARRAFREGKLLMLLGGDHSVPNGVWNAIRKVFSTATILQLDAHLDLRDRLDGTGYSHACIMRRARDKDFRTIHVGPRDHISREEARYIAKEGMSKDVYFCPTQPAHFYDCNFETLERSRVMRAENMILEGVPDEEQLASICQKLGLSKNVWISIDIDCLDASHAPGTGTPLPMGLSREGLRTTLYHAVRVINKMEVRLLGFDICEVAPQLRKQGTYTPSNTVSTMAEMDAALLAYNILFWRYMDRFQRRKRK